MDLTNCPVCLNATLEDKFQAQPLDYSSTDNFCIAKCTHCGHGISRNVSYTTESYEGGAYDEQEKVWHRLISPLLGLLEKNKVRYVSKFVSHKSIVLEIGAGKGKFLRTLNHSGYEAYGIEPSKRSYEVAKKLVGESVFNCTVEEIHGIPEINRKFDLIILWHVLEHLEHPGELLKKLKDNLSSDGHIMIGVPNFASWQANYGKSDWYHLDPSRHLSHFTPNSLKLLGQKNGYTVKEIFFNSFYQNFLGELITLTNKFSPYKNVILNSLRLNKNYLKRTGPFLAFLMLVLISIMSLILFLPLTIFTSFSQLRKKSGTMVFVLKNSSVN